MPQIRVYFAFRSPYSRLALHKLAEAGVAAELITFTGPPVGTQFEDPVQNKAKLAYYREDVVRMTARAGLPFTPPKPFEVDYTPADRTFVAANAAGRGMAFALTVSNARWGEGHNISDLVTLRDCLTVVGLDPALAETAQIDDAVAETFAAQRALHEQDQVFGVPFMVAESGKYWGHDRIDIMLEDLGVA